MPEYQCVVCGKSFSPKSPRIVACSPECKIDRQRELGRRKYTVELERQGKRRTRGSAQSGRLRCEVEGCDGKYYAKGMCNMHYAQEWRKAKPEPSRNASRRYRRQVNGRR